MATIFTGIMPTKVDVSSGKRPPKRGAVATPAKRTPLKRDVPTDALGGPTANAPAPSESGVSFEADALNVLGPLQTSLADILDSLPGRLERSTDLQHLLKSDPKLAWQIYKFVKAPAVLPASSSLPGAVAMQRFYKLAAKKGADKARIDAGIRAFAAFEQFVRDRAGDRRSFNTMAGGGRNDGQATNLAHKKAAFRAAAHFLGVQTDVIAITFLAHPSRQSPGKWDLATLVYKVGIRRLRPDARIMLAHVGKSNAGDVSEAANRFEPIEPDVDASFVATLLPPFCSNATADTVIKHERDEYVEMEIAATSVGTAGATDWAFGVVERNAAISPLAGGPLKFRADISAAVQTLVVDVFVANGDVGDPSSNVRTYLSSRDNTRSEHERLNLNESVVAMGRGDVAAQRSDIVRYSDLVQYACGRLGWDVTHFRAYRCRVEYPVLGSTIDIHFDYPAIQTGP